MGEEAVDAHCSWKLGGHCRGCFLGLYRAIAQYVSVVIRPALGIDMCGEVMD